MIVVDASALLEVLLRTDVSVEVERRIFARGESLHAPHLIDLEVAHVLRRYNREGALGVTRGGQALADLAAMPLTRYPHHVLLPRVWELRHNLTAHDAVYVALAETLRAPLVTRDSRLSREAGRRAKVELI